MGAGFNQREFLESWCEEFARAIEMFSGSKAVVECSPATYSPEQRSLWKNYLWWKQVFEQGSRRFTTWTGAAETTWTALGASMAEDASGARQIYLEVLGQAEQGAATLLSRRLGSEVRSQTGEIEESFSFDAPDFWDIKISPAEKELPPLIYAIDSSDMQKANMSDLDTARSSEQTKSLSERSHAPGIDQLLDLELPLSVVLGRRVMQIQDVLKLASGSVVELDSTVSDRVEVLVQGKIVARGEVVSVKGNYGVRITDIVHNKTGWN